MKEKTQSKQQLGETEAKSIVAGIFEEIWDNEHVK